jgi:thiol-disulfide isomerase/thioredoxin
MTITHVQKVLLVAMAGSSSAWQLAITPVSFCSRAAPPLLCAEPERQAQRDTPRPPSALSLLAATVPAAAVVPTNGAACDPTLTPDQRRRNVALAIAAPFAATLAYALQRLNPVNPVALLARMEERSPALSDALASGNPTLVEFYAPWCTSCKEAAPSMMRMQAHYQGRVNFVVVNGDDPRNLDLVRLFGVDGIPHLSLISSERKVAGTLVGAVPERVVESSLEALAAGKPLPYGASEG